MVRLFLTSEVDKVEKLDSCLNTLQTPVEALELSKVQEQTRQQEQMVKVKEYEASIEQMKIEQKRVEGEQRRKFLEEEGKQAKLKSEYQDQLAR